MNANQAATTAGPGLFALAGIGLAYYLGARLGLTFTVMPEGTAILWPPNAVLLAALLRYDGAGWLRLVPLILIAQLLATMPDFTAVEAVLFGVVNIIEASLAFMLLRRSGFDPSLSRIEDLLRFTLAAPLAAAFVAALAGATVYTAFRGGETAYVEFLLIWWFSDALGLVILTPMILRFWLPDPFGAERPVTPPFRAWDLRAAAVGVVVLALSLHTGQLVDFHLDPILVMPFVLHFCARFGTRHAALLVGGLALVLIIATTQGWASFGGPDAKAIVVRTQEYLFIMTLTGLGLAEIVEQYRYQRSQLETANQRLEERVEERTRELRQANEALETRVAERTERLRELNSRLRRYALTDPLTNLPNRRALVKNLKAHTARARRDADPLIVLLIDIDGLKTINDVHGHDRGDAAIRTFGRALKYSVRTGDTVARTGGDEFVVFGSARDAEDAPALAERILQAVRASYVEIQGRRRHLTASIGVTNLDIADSAIRDTLRRADQALYTAKRNGRDGYVLRNAAQPVGRVSPSSSDGQA